MEKEEFKKIVKGLKSIYADPKFIADQFAYDMWFALLGDLPYEVVSMATKAYMQSETFPPTPADIRRYAYKVTSPVTEDMSEIEAWGLVRKALNNGYYGAETEFEKLPPLIQETLGNPARLREMSQLDVSEVETVEQSHFVRNYRAKLESHRKNGQLDKGLQASINQIRQDNTPQIEILVDASNLIEDLQKEDTGIPDDVEQALANFHKGIF